MNSLALFTAIALIVFATIAAAAQTDSYAPPELLNTPGIFIPDEAALTGLGGLVRVRISIDERGNVTGVEDVTGPGWTCPQVSRADVVAMREAATKAAMIARFKPATQNSIPVTSSTSLNFNFPVGESIEARTLSRGSSDLQKGVINGRSNLATETAGAVIAVKRNDKVNESQRIKPPRQISGGVLNGKAVSLVKPRWPAAARETGGTVTVNVLIDTNGDVFSAETLTGHPLFRFAARSGACESKFAPTILSSGEPVRVTGVIVYNFTKP
jgi:hypothetical protein